MSTAQKNHRADVTDEQRAQLATSGFYITDVLFDDEEIAAMRKELLRIASAQKEANKAGGTFAYALHEHSAPCREFLRHPVFQSLCTQLLGPEVYQTWNQMIVKMPETGGNFAWHQDGYYGAFAPDGTPTDDRAAMSASETLTFWVALTDATIDNGCLWALPGRHAEGFLPHRWNEAGKEWVGTYSTEEEIPVELKAGQMLVFTRLTPHRSGANITEEPRIGYQIGYAVEAGHYDRVPFLADGRLV
ncbi:MAG: phytanoyl-CoA dioxygenase family protein [Microbacterium sp.]|nr:phytanoyl-CoA dioxygenase family protein [Microbacterium sp.]